MTTRSPMKNNAFDAVNGTLAVSYLTAWMHGWTLADWATLAALVYSVILIVDKVWQMILRAQEKRAAKNGQ